MSEKSKYNIWIPDQTAEEILDLEDFIDNLIIYYQFLNSFNFDEVKYMKNLDSKVRETTEEYSRISQEYGKIIQEYGVINFRGNELFTRNTVTGLKLGLIMGKLEHAKAIWGDRLNLDYHAAKELIQHFSDRYLTKKDEE